MQVSSNALHILKPTERLQQLLPDVFSPQIAEGEQFLKIQLTPQLTIALSLDWVEESLLLPAHLITPMPNTSPSVLGLMSSREQVFWAVDLAQLLGVPTVQVSSQGYEVVVIRAFRIDSNQVLDMGTASANEELFWGLVVPKIRNSIRLLPENIVSPENEVDIGLQPYLNGQVVADGEEILVLSAEAIGKAQVLMAAYA